MYLDITIKKSYIAKNLVLACYLLCAFAIFLSDLTVSYRIIIFSLLVFCVYHTLTKFFFTNQQAIKEICYYDDQWKIKLGNTKVAATLTKYFIAYNIVCLYYQIGNSNYSLVLFKDSYSQTERHNLQLGLILKVYYC
jgi:hypothetical protein